MSSTTTPPKRTVRFCHSYLKLATYTVNPIEAMIHRMVAAIAPGETHRHCGLSHIGRLFEAMEDLGVLSDTLVFVIIGDNGASAEGNS